MSRGRNRPGYMVSDAYERPMNGRTVSIDRDRCDGCGLCVSACHEGAIALVEGKAALVRADMCDGLGDCLPACPRNAISFGDGDIATTPNLMAEPTVQWPIQIGLVPPRSSHFKGALVIAADCTAFKVDDFVRRFVGDRAVIIGCPKLDDRARFEKIREILGNNPVDAVEIVRMEVPCCSALSGIVRDAVSKCGRDVTVRETVIGRNGSIVRSD